MSERETDVIDLGIKKNWKMLLYITIINTTKMVYWSEVMVFMKEKEISICILWWDLTGEGEGEGEGLLVKA